MSDERPPSDRKLPVVPEPKNPSLPERIKQVPTSLRNVELIRGLPNATIIYAAGAGILFAMSFYHLTKGHWLSALLILLPAACLVGYAVFYLKTDK
jgi:hypothetical protein